MRPDGLAGEAKGDGSDTDIEVLPNWSADGFGTKEHDVVPSFQTPSDIGPAHSPRGLAHISEHFARSKEAGIVAPVVEAVLVIVQIQKSAECGVGSSG